MIYLYITSDLRHQDQKYIEALVRGDEQLIGEIYDRFAPDCKQFVLKNSGTSVDAMDIFQETIIATLVKAKREQLEIKVSLRSYLYGVYRNKWIDVLRKRNKFPQTIIEDDRFIDDASNLKEMQYRIYKMCFEQMGDECQKLINFKVKGMRGNDIAAKMNITRNNVNQKVLICRERLKKCCQNHPEFEEL